MAQPLSATEAAKMLGLSPRQVRILAESGKLIGKKTVQNGGTAWNFSYHNVLQFKKTPRPGCGRPRTKPRKIPAPT